MTHDEALQWAIREIAVNDEPFTRELLKAISSGFFVVGVDEDGKVLFWRRPRRRPMPR